MIEADLCRAEVNKRVDDLRSRAFFTFKPEDAHKIVIARGGNTLELVCRPDRLAYAVREGIPLMLPEEARALSADDPLLDR